MVDVDSANKSNSSEENVIKCNVKTKTFSIPKRNATELNKKSRFYRCPVCKEKFPKLAAMNAHYREMHPPLYCKMCEKEFITPNALERHSYFHKSLKFKCKKCDEWFPFKSSMESHMTSHETEKKH